VKVLNTFWTLETIEQQGKNKKKQEQNKHVQRTKCLKKCIKSSNFETPLSFVFLFVCFEWFKWVVNLNSPIPLWTNLTMFKDFKLQHLPCQIEHLLFQIEHYFQTSYFSNFFCPFWAIFIVLDVPLEVHNTSLSFKHSQITS